MWLFEMKSFAHFSPKVFAVVALVVCAVIARVVSWATGMNFWILFGITVAGMLINGLIASIEDGDEF